MNVSIPTLTENLYYLFFVRTEPRSQGPPGPGLMAPRPRALDQDHRPQAWGFRVRPWGLSPPSPGPGWGDWAPSLEIALGPKPWALLRGETHCGCPVNVGIKPSRVASKAVPEDLCSFSQIFPCYHEPALVFPCKNKKGEKDPYLRYFSP